MAVFCLLLPFKYVESKVTELLRVPPNLVAAFTNDVASREIRDRLQNVFKQCLKLPVRILTRLRESHPCVAIFLVLLTRGRSSNALVGMVDLLKNLIGLAPGLKWKEVGPARPRTGSEITNEKLAKALQGSAHFTQRQLETFDLAELSWDSYIKVRIAGQDKYFKPADGDSGQRRSDGQKWQTGIRLLQEDPLPTSARQFEEAQRILKTQYDLFEQQTEAGKFNETLEQRLADALIAATSCMGVPDVDDVIAKPFNYDTPVLEVCAYMDQVCCAAVAVMMRRLQLRYKLVLAVNALMDVMKSPALLQRLGLTAATVYEENLDEFIKVPTMPRFRSGFTFDDNLLISERNQTVSVTAEQQQHLSQFASQDATCFQAIQMPGWTAVACANNFPAEFVAGGAHPSKAASALLTWMLSLAKVTPPAQASESAFRDKADAEVKLEAMKTKMGYPVPPPFHEVTDRAKDKKTKEFWTTFCYRNPEFNKGGGKSPEDVMTYLTRFWPRKWDGAAEAQAGANRIKGGEWVFKKHTDDVEKDWLPDELDIAGLRPFVEFVGSEGSYTGIFEEELKNKLEVAIDASADPATVDLLLAQPSMNFEGVQEAGLQNSHHLASHASSSITARDDECEACAGKRARHTCSGATIFSHLVRRVHKLKKWCSDIAHKLDVIQGARAKRRDAVVGAYTADFAALNHLLVATVDSKDGQNVDGFQQMADLVSSIAEFLFEIGVREPPGLQWKTVGPAKPETGTEIGNVKLAAALQQKSQFSRQELDHFSLTPTERAKLSYDDYIKVKDEYFKPDDLLEAAISDRVSIDELRLRSQKKEVFDITTLGLKWNLAGDEKPKKGRSLEHPELAKALAYKTDFSEKEWEAFGIQDLRKDDFILSEATLGSKWKEVGEKKPETGRELSNPALQKALKEKKVFSKADLDRYKVDEGEISWDSYIKVRINQADKYFKPAGGSYFQPEAKPKSIKINAFDNAAVRADLLLLASAVLATDLTRKHFKASRDLLHSMASLKPMLRAGCGHVATCSDLAILLQACEDGADVPPSPLLNCFVADRHAYDDVVQCWQPGPAWMGVKFVGSWPNLSEMLGHLLSEYMRGDSMVPVCNGRCRGGSCCKSDRYQQLMAWLLYGYCIPAAHPVTDGDQEQMRKRVYNAQERRLTLISLAFASNVFRCVDISGSTRLHVQSLTVCMVSLPHKLVVWYDDQELPMRNFGKLLAVEHGDSSFRLHLQPITSSHLTSGHHIILNLSCYPGTETKALLRRKNSEQPWSMLPGLGTWEEGAEYDMVPASLEDFASAFDYCLKARPDNLFSKFLAPKIGATQGMLLQILMGFVLAPGNVYGATRSMCADLLHVLAAWGTCEQLQAFLCACYEQLDAAVVTEMLNTHDRIDQMTLVLVPPPTPSAHLRPPPCSAPPHCSGSAL